MTSAVTTKSGKGVSEEWSPSWPPTGRSYPATRTNCAPRLSGSRPR